MSKLKLNGWFEDDPKAEEYDKHGKVQLVYYTSVLTRNVLDEISEDHDIYRCSYKYKKRIVPDDKMVRSRSVNRVYHITKP